MTPEFTFCVTRRIAESRKSMPGAGLEPTWGCPQGILRAVPATTSLARPVTAQQRPATIGTERNPRCHSACHSHLHSFSSR